MEERPTGAGASARREHERRKLRDEQRTRARHPRLGGLLLRFGEERQSTRAWDRGAWGEERVGARLDGLVSPTLFVLHDRRIPRSRANIDHLVVTRGGVWVVDTKRYKGRPELKLEGGLLRPRVEKLLVARRDKTGLVDGVLRQMDAVSAVLGDVPLRAALCFVDADFPALGGAFVTRGVHVVWPRRLAKLVTRDDHGEVDVRVTAERLAQTFRPA